MRVEEKTCCSDMPSLFSIAQPRNHTFSLLFGFTSIDILAGSVDGILNVMKKCAHTQTQILLAPRIPENLRGIYFAFGVFPFSLVSYIAPLVHIKCLHRLCRRE